MHKTEYEYNGIKYYVNKGKGSIKCKERPKSIFKYYALNEHSIDALTNGYLYASHPFDLNDILDSSQFLLYTTKRVQYSRYYDLLMPLFEGKENELTEFYKHDSTQQGCRGILTHEWHIISDKFGIISMTGKDSHSLMWPHYTQEKGFQIKMCLDKLEESIVDKLNDGYLVGIFPMNYVEQLSSIDASEFEHLTIPFLYMTNIKSKDWCYEDEWRIIVSRDDMGVPFQKKGFSRISDRKVDKVRRFAFYDKGLVEEITLGMDYFNGYDFEIKQSDDERSFYIRIIDDEINDNSNYKVHEKLLNYIGDNLKSKLYLSSVSVEYDSNGLPYMIRTKEKIEIEKVDNENFILTRTNKMIK